MQDQYVAAQSPFRTDVPTRALGAPEDINVGAPQMGGPANGRALGAPEAPRQFANGNRFFNAQGMARQPYRDTFAPGADASMPRGMNRMLHQMQRASGNTANPERQFANGNQFVNANGMLRKPYRNMPGQMQGAMGQGGSPAVDDMAGRMQQRQSEVPAGYASPQLPPNWQELQREFTPPPVTDMAAYSAWFRNMQAKYPTYGHGDTTMNLDIGRSPYSPRNQQFRGPMQSFMNGNPFASMGMQFGMPGGWQGAQPFYPSAQSMPGIGSMFGGY